ARLGLDVLLDEPADAVRQHDAAYGRVPGERVGERRRRALGVNDGRGKPEHGRGEQREAQAEQGGARTHRILQCGKAGDGDGAGGKLVREEAGCGYLMCAITASANALHFTSVAPGMSRAKS